MRYVEVKARAQSGAMRLSSNEWEKARGFGEKLWLYVVTEAGTDEPELHRIRTPTDWMPRDASHERQLLGATAHGRCILTFNVREFIALAQRYPRHGGIVLAAQSSWALSELIAALDRLLRETEAGPSTALRASAWTGQVRWLSEWRKR